jgi:uracil-DNA glycosylase family protein
VKEDKLSPKIAGIKSLSDLEKLAHRCTNCDLFKNGNLVFGEGKKTFRVVMVGEQPGNEEEIEGRPFVGPSGKFLRGLLEKIGIDEEKIYYTNAVKHFRYDPVGKRRIHKTPKLSQSKACHIWLEKELKLIKPDLIVCLGKTAAQSVLEKTVSVNQIRGKIQQSERFGSVLVTFHPSYFLRIIDRQDREKLLDLYKKDLRQIAKFLKK